jgi:hypothetical protein
VCRRCRRRLCCPRSWRRHCSVVVVVVVVVVESLSRPSGLPPVQQQLMTARKDKKDRKARESARRASSLDLLVV